MIEYYPSLDGFLRVKAEPIGYITDEWIPEHLDMSAIETQLTEHIERADPTSIDVPWQYEDWTPSGDIRVRSVSAVLDDVYVWEYETEEVEVFLTFYATIEAEVECEREEGDPIYEGYRTEQREITCELERTAEFSARIDGDELEVLELQDIEKS